MTANHEADRLDAWLESITGGSAKFPNGAADQSPEALASVARRYHASLHAAEQRAVPTIPARAIWEDVMQNTAPINRITLPPTGLGNGDRLPPASPPTASGWGMPNPGNWIVSAIVVAIVVIGVFAVYATFFNESATPPPTTGRPGLAVSSPIASMSTPETNIDRWLADQSNASCASPETGSGQQPDAAATPRPTGRPMDVDDYLPFSTASESDRETIAERFLNIQTNCPPTADDPIVSDDFSWMPGPSVALASQDQIETAQHISAELPIQNYLDYYVVRSPSDAETMDGMGVLLPQDVMTLPDGRLGGPLRIVLQTDTPVETIRDMTDGRDFAAPVFVVFEQVDGLWLYDELFLLCIGDCNDYWAMVSGEMPLPGTPHASPVASPTATTPDLSEPHAVCDVEPRTLQEISALQQAPPDVPAREYGPISPVNDDLAQQIAAANQLLDACRMAGETRSMASPRLIYETRETGFFGPQWPPTTLEKFDDFVVEQKELSAIFPTNNPSDYAVETDQLEGDDFARLILPQNVVQLADGRVGGPVTSYYPTGRENSPYNYALVEVNIFTQDPTQNDRWVVDESLLLCVGDCDAYYEDIRSDLSSAELPATPVASPAVSEAWLQPITAAECTVEGLSTIEVSAIIRDPAESPERSYVPVGPADPDIAQQVAAADRAWQACGWFGSIGQRTVLQTDRLTSQGPEDPGSTNVSQNMTAAEHTEFILNRFDDRRAMGEAISTGDWRDYVRPSEDAATDVYDAAQFNTVTTLPWAEGAVELADGRIAIPVVRLVSPEDWEFSQESIEEGWFTFVNGTVHILALDPETNAWVVDEVISMCLINCDEARIWLVDFLQSQEDLYNEIRGTPTVAPEATPAGTLPANRSATAPGSSRFS